jgi:RND family efflux transporter MFP subunit
MKLPALYSSILLLSLLIPALAVTYDTEQVPAISYVDSIQRTGKLDFKRTINLSFKSSGFLTQLNVDEGQEFKQGDILASLDVAELIEDKNAKYARLLQAKRDVKRNKRLMAEKLASQRELEDSLTLVETERASYQIAFYNLEKAQILAPFNGVVLTRSTEMGELQSPGSMVLKVASLVNNWVVKVALTGSEIGQVRLGQKVQVELENLGGVEGVINRIPAIANTDGHLFTIDILLPEMPLRNGVVAGQLAKVVIDFTSDNLVYKVPVSALVSVNSQGQAIIMIEANQSVSEKVFDVFKLNSEFIYVMSNEDLNPLNFVIKGWQQIELGE